MNPFNGSIWEFVQPVLGFETVNDDLNAAVAPERVKLNNYYGCGVMITKPAGTAGDDLSLTLEQHTAATSGTSKALTACRGLWFNLGATTLAAATGWVYASITEASAIVTDVLVGGIVRYSNDSNFVVGAAVVDITADSNDAIILLDIKSDQMDGGGGYNWFSVDSDHDAIGNALVANMHYMLYGPKHGGLIHPSAIA